MIHGQSTKRNTTTHQNNPFKHSFFVSVSVFFADQGLVFDFGPGQKEHKNDSNHVNSKNDQTKFTFKNHF